MGAAARWVALVVPALLTPCARAAQGTVSGTVTDVSGAPVPYAGIELRDGTLISADAEGRFVLNGMGSGVAWIAAIGPRCAVALDSVLVPADGDAVVRLQLTGAPGDRAGGESAVGMSRAELTARNFRSVYEALRVLAPYMVSHMTGEVGGDRYVSNRAGRTFGGNAPLVMLDGIRLTDVTVAALEDIPIEDLERIEVARGASASFRYGMGSAGGVIVLTTTRSGQPLVPSDPGACEVVFPPGA